MNVDERIQAFVKLGEKLQNQDMLSKAIAQSIDENPCFLKQNVQYAIDAIVQNLQENVLAKWLQAYAKSFSSERERFCVMIVMAGNIPLVGFHDFLCVLASGMQATIKLSSSDKFLLPTIVQQLVSIEPRFEKLISFVSGKFENIPNNVDAIIATGSDNTARYFEYYFSEKPSIIRKNRNSIAILSGNETFEELQNLADDIFLHIGMGCRSVSKLFVPPAYNFSLFFEACKKYDYLQNVQKFMNNYRYYKTIYQMNCQNLQDNGFCNFVESSQLSSPIAVVHFEYYQNAAFVQQILHEKKEKLQCIVASPSFLPNAIPFGKAQQPELSDYADNVDTMQWLSKLKCN